MCAFVDHGADGTGEPLQIMLRPGNAGSNTAADHIAVTRKAAGAAARASARRAGRAARCWSAIDGAGATHDFLDWLTGSGCRTRSGSPCRDITASSSPRSPTQVWTPAYDADDQVRDGAWVAELTDLLDLTGWPNGMRVIARKERPHPGAQLRLTDVDGLPGHRVRHQHHPAGSCPT